MKTFGELFNESWKEYRNNFKVFFIIFLLLFAIPSLILLSLEIANNYIIFKADIESIEGILSILNTGYIIFLMLLFIVQITTLALWLFMQVCFIYNAVYRKKKMGIRETLSGGKKYFWKYFGYLLVFIVFISGLFLLLIIPGIIFLVFWSFSSYILIKENKGIIDSLGKSYSLVKGKWWRTFGISLIFFIVLMGIYIIFLIGSESINLIFYRPYIDFWNIENLIESSIISLEILPFPIYIATSLISSIFYWIYSLISIPLAILFFKNMYLDYR